MPKSISKAKHTIQ